jgi:hypothetical protein
MWLVVCSSAVRGAEVVPYDDALKKQKPVVEGFLRDGIPGGKEQIFDDYITKYAVPQFVLRSNANNFRAVRDNFHNKLVKIAKDGLPARRRLLELTVEGFNKILTDPALGKDFVGDDNAKWAAWTSAKVNVVLELGDLHETGTGSTAKPLAAALPILLEIVKPPAKAVRPRDDAVRVAAVIALEHHAEYASASAETRTKIRDAMLAIVERQKPPVGREVAVNDHLRARAAEVLGLMKEVGPKNNVVLALDRVIANPAESVRLRCQAAKALGTFEYPTGSTLNFKSLADHIGHLVVDVCQEQIKQAGQEPLDSNARRRLVPLIRDAYEGLSREAGHSGLVAAPADPTQHAFVDNVSKKVKNILVVLDKETDGSGTLATAKVAAPMNDLESILEPRVEAAPADKPVEKPSEEAEALAG